MPRSTFRSVTYDLDASIAVARQVAGSPAGIPSEDLARALGYSGARNGAFLTRLANARLFGVVAGSSSRVILTDRGALAASADTQLSGPARVEAFLAVPLFRAVMDHLGDGPVPGPEELASMLRDRFGEAPSKARTSANKLSDSARQAGILQRFPDDTDRFTREYDSFTDFTDDAGLAHSGDLLSPTAPRRAGGPPEGASPAVSSIPGAGEAGTPMDSFGEADGMQPDGSDGSDGIWLEEPRGPGDGPGRGRRRLALVLAVVVCLAVVAVPVSLALTGSGTKVQHRAVAKINTPTQLKSSPQAVSAVLSALSATTDSGNFDFSYTLNSQAGTVATTSTTTTSTTTVCQLSGSGPSVMPRSGTVVAVPATGTVTGGPMESPPFTAPTTSPIGGGGVNCYSVNPGPVLQGAVPVTGSGVINVNPSAMVTSATVGGGLNVVLRENETNYWEDLGGGQATLAPGSSTQGSGSALGGFASLVSGTLGVREGPVAMMSLSSPSGYLDLYQSEVTAAEEVGPGTVAGTPVTVYKIPVTPAQEGQVPGSSEETQTIAAALSSLQAQGYTGTTVKISIDAEGYILRAESIANFSDGGTVDLTATFSNFGCAGTVLMPGQTGTGVPPVNCTSPVPPTPTTTTPTTSTPTTSPSTTPGGSTASTTPGSTPPTTVAAPTTVPSSPGSSTTTSTSAPGSTTTAAGG